MFIECLVMLVRRLVRGKFECTPERNQRSSDTPRLPQVSFFLRVTYHSHRLKEIKRKFIPRDHFPSFQVLSVNAFFIFLNFFYYPSYLVQYDTSLGILNAWISFRLSKIIMEHRLGLGRENTGILTQILKPI